MFTTTLLGLQVNLAHMLGLIIAGTMFYIATIPLRD
jgi:hypothetical protein